MGGAAALSIKHDPTRRVSLRAACVVGGSRLEEGLGAKIPRELLYTRVAFDETSSGIQVLRVAWGANCSRIIGVSMRWDRYFYALGPQIMKNYRYFFLITINIFGLFII